MGQMIKIHYRRDPKYTTGPLNCSWADVDGVRYEIPQAKGNNGGVVYRLIAKLCDAGYTGQKFHAEDHRGIGFSGVLDKRAIPSSHGGISRKKTGLNRMDGSARNDGVSQRHQAIFG